MRFDGMGGYDDLYNAQQQMPESKTFFNINETYYRNPGRWDCIYTIPVPSARQPASGSFDGYPRYGFWTASPYNNTMGFGITHDGVHWTALPSPEMRTAARLSEGELRMPRPCSRPAAQ